MNNFKLLILTFTVVLASCSSEELALKKIKELCSTDGGVFVYRTAVVDGYYNDFDAINLAQSAYDFVEHCQNKPPGFDRDLGPGCFRYSKVSREKGICNEKLDKIFSRFKVEPFPTFVRTQCVAIEKIDEPTAEYRYKVERNRVWYEERSGAEITRFEGIIASSSGEVLSRAISYGMYERRGDPRDIVPPERIGCGHPKVTGNYESVTFAGGQIEKTLIARSTIE